MRMDFKKGQRIKIEGPASILIKNGVLWGFGKEIHDRERITVPIDKNILLEVLEDTIAEVNLGENATIDKIEDPIIPYEWRSSIENIYNDIRPLKILILGGANTGKSLFAIHLANFYSAKNEKVGVIDEDLGQSEIGPPTVIGSTLITKPITSFSQSKLYDGYFIGTIDPEEVTENILVGVKILLEKILKENPHIVIINTDGWILGEKARRFKLNMINLLRPEVIIAVQRFNEIEHIIGPLEKLKWLQIIRLLAPPILKPRSPELRKLIRESMYTRYLKNLKVIKVNIRNIPLMFSSYASSFPPPLRIMEKIKTSLKEDLFKKVEYIGMNSEELIVVINDTSIKDTLSNILENMFADKKIKVIKKGDEHGVIVGIYDYNNRFLGIGYIDEIHYKQGIIKIKAGISSSNIIGLICLGQLKLDEKYNERKRVKMWDL